MHPPQRLAVDQPLQRLQAERVLAQRQRALAAQVPLAQPGKVARQRVVGAVDDPQVLPAAHLEARLHEPAARRPGEVGQRFHHHALSPGPGEVEPPLLAGGPAGRVGGVDGQPPRGAEQVRVGRHQPVGDRQVPLVVAVGEGRPGGGEHLEGGQLHARQPVGVPPVPLPGGLVATGVGEPGDRALQQLGDLQPAPGRGLQRLDRRRQREQGGGTDRRVVLAQQPPGLQRPGQQFGVQQQPVGVQFGVDPGGPHRPPHPRDELLRQRGRQERPARPRVDHAGVAAQVHHGPGAHVLLLAQHLPDAPLGELGERLLRVFEVVGQRGGAHRRHGRRQVGQQRRVQREPAHHLQGAGGVLGRHGEESHRRGLDRAPAEHVGEPQFVRCPLPGRGSERLHRFVVDGERVDRHGLALGIAQRRQPAAEDAAGVEAEGVVHPFQFGRGRVAVGDQRPAAVLLRPRVAHGQPELVGLAGGVAVERERAHPARRPVVVGLLQPGVGDDEPAAVEHQVGDQPVAPVAHLRAELLGLGVELGEGQLQPVGALHVVPVERADQLRLVVSRDGERVPSRRHAHREPQHPDRGRAAVDEVADEDHPSPVGVDGVDRAALPVHDRAVAEPVQQREQLGEAAVDVADDVERAGLVGEVAEQPFAHDGGRLHLLDAVQHVHAAEALLGQRPQPTPELGGLPPDRAVAEGPVGAEAVAFDRHLDSHVEHDRHRQHVVVAGQLDQRLPGRAGDAGGVHHGQQAAVEPLAGDVVQHLEGVGGSRLVVLVTADQGAAEVGAEHLVGAEGAGGERGLARAGDPDQDHQAEGRNSEGGHAGSRRLKRASWVGGPSSGSGSPTSR